MQPRTLILTVLVALMLAGCATASARPVSESHRLEDVTRVLNKDLTPEKAEQTLGPPDEVTGSGLLIYIYHLNDGRKVWLGFPGYEPIIYARVQDQAGNTTDLPLQD
jgi:hypothetical protein